MARIHRPGYCEKLIQRRVERCGMIRCYLRYELDPDKLAEFEAYGGMWLELMPRFGGIHHG
jgi:hypothetical protein